MRRLIPLMFLALAACDAPFEEAFPPQKFSISKGARVYDVRAQYDPFELAWFTRISVYGERLAYDDRGEVIDLVEQEVGARLCDGGRLDFEPGRVWQLLDEVFPQSATGLSHHMPETGQWQIVAPCL